MICCSERRLPFSEQVAAFNTAVRHNPANRPALERIAFLVPNTTPQPAHLALLATKYWGSGGVHLTVSFMETTPADLAARILSHMNAWGEFCNVKFSAVPSGGQVRISREPGGYWSYLGTDILHIPAGQQTMNLEGFTMQTPEGEFHRVVRHETGHTLGFPHEHMRAEIVARIDRAKAIEYFGQTQGWSAAEVIQQVLTPLEEGSMVGRTLHADVNSIMCYQLPGLVTTDGRPIPGGTDIDPSDKELAARMYPLSAPPPPPPPAAGVVTLSVAGLPPGYSVRLAG